ncbi:MAG: HD domain-containing protein [Patescibacteria group bacterium]|nr:HD domain-containing protein [Patescibacteria group bacterium]MCL5095520.1 HD domain-containing protein [Patescibacteria group bacterium]
MTYKLPPSAQKVLTTMKKAGFETYAVGGSVRDLLMGRPTKNWDFTTSAVPSEILKIYPDGFYDNAFGTVGVALENGEIYEITTFRTESNYKDHRHPEKVLWGQTLLEDLGRRDFTVGAIAFDGKNFIDPYNGQKDLKDKIIRTVGNPNQRFAEDALRLMRAIRIATELEFLLEAETFAAIVANAALIREISSERVKEELLKILATDHSADGIALLKNAGLLQKILPEVEKGFGVNQVSPGRHHLYDVGTHSFLSLKFCPSQDPLVRLATLIHDIGKPATFKQDEKGLITFYNHEVIGASLARHLADRLKLSKKDRDRLVTMVRWHQFSVDEKQTDSALRRFIRRVGKENLKDMLDLRIGDRLGGGARETSWRLKLFIKRLDEVQKQPFTVADLKVDGHDVMEILNLDSGPKVGEILNMLFNEVVEKGEPNERSSLLKKIKNLTS